MTTHLGARDAVEITELVGRIEVDAQVELGVVPVEGTIIANRTVLTNDGRRAIFWTELDLTVGNSRKSSRTIIDLVPGCSSTTRQP